MDTLNLTLAVGMDVFFPLIGGKITAIVDLGPDKPYRVTINGMTTVDVPKPKPPVPPRG